MSLVGVDEAVGVLRAGGLVGVPSETVYGLAADGTNAAAVASVFARKGRPRGHPLILHVLDDPWAYAARDPRAEALVARFWPGPLTLVLPRLPSALDEVTGGRSTVAVRSPSHPVFRALLAGLGRPIAAPSANRFGGVSPTTAAHVLSDFPDLPVVDGGDADVGVESTILALLGDRPAILRPGAVDRDALVAVLGPVDATGDTPAPGNLPSHYAPRARVEVSDDPEGLARSLVAAGLRVAVLPPEPPGRYAATLYERLRAHDASGVDVIVAPWCSDVGVGAAVNDRLRRAAAGR